jgi:hypothetical protein
MYIRGEQGTLSFFFFPFQRIKGSQTMGRKRQGLKGREFLRLLPEKERTSVRATMKLLPGDERQKILAADLSKEPIRVAYSSPETMQEISKLSREDLKRIQAGSKRKYKTKKKS